MLGSIRTKLLNLNLGRRCFRFSTPLLAEEQFARLKDIILIRHGESEGNIAYRQSLAGDHRFLFPLLFPEQEGPLSFPLSSFYGF